MATNSFERHNMHETISVESKTETDPGGFIQKMKNYLCSDIRESIERMTLSLGNHKKKQKDCERNLSSLKSNLNELRQIIFDSSSAVNSQLPESLHQEIYLTATKKGDKKKAFDRSENQLDEEISRDLTRFLMNEMEEAVYKLEENISEAQDIEAKNIRHLETMGEVVQDAELELKKEEKRKFSSACPKCGTKKTPTKYADAGVITEKMVENTDRSRRESKKESLQTEDNLNPAKRLKLDEEMSSPSTSKGGSSSFDAKGSPDKEKQPKVKVEDGDRTFAEDESMGSRRSVEDHLEDAENHVLELRKRISTFEELLVENRRVLSSLTESLDSVWNANREEKRNRELEKMAADTTEFMQSLASQGGWNQTSFSQPGPSNAENELGTLKKNFAAPEFTWCNTPNKAYFDTRTAIAQDAIKRTIGPLGPEQMTCFLDEVRKKQNVMYLIRRFTNDLVSLVQQLKWIKSNLDDSYKSYISGPGNRAQDFDRRLALRLETLIKNIERFI